MLMEKCAPPSCQFFGFFLTQNKSLCRAPIVLLNLVEHLSKTGEELVYYHLYHEE